MSNLSVGTSPLRKNWQDNSGWIFIKENNAFAFLALFILVNVFITPNFLQLGTFRTILMQAFPIVIIGLGMTLVIATQGIDVSVGVVMAIAASSAARLYDSGVSLGVCLLVGLIAAAICGVFNGFLIAKFDIQPIIITLILMIGGRGLAQIILGELTISFYDTAYASVGSMKLFGSIPIQIVIMFTLIGLVYYLVTSMTVGKYIVAVGDSKSAAKLAGLNVFGTLMFVYVLCALMAGVAGIMEAARINSVNAGRFGELMELDAIAAVAIGGTAFSGGKVKVIGTVMGGIVVSLITITMTMNNVSYNYALLLKALVIILILVMQKNDGR